MRHSRLFRLLTALFGVWFTFTLVQPNGMMGMTMSGSDASMNMSLMNMASMKMSSANMMVANTPESASHEMTSHRMNTQEMAAMHDASSNNDGADQSLVEQRTTDQQSAPVECDQHDCCCSALSPISLMPVATLAWLPDHVINQEIPQRGECVVTTDAQIKLPFANGPPRTVSA